MVTDYDREVSFQECGLHSVSSELCSKAALVDRGNQPRGW